MAYKNKADERAYNTAYYKQNGERIRSQVKDWRSRNTDKTYFYTIKYKYGINREQYFCLLDSQGRRCAICRRTPEEVGRPLDVDHCHATNRVRGLLCNRCNLMLANAVDNVDFLNRGAQYLTDRTT